MCEESKKAKRKALQLLTRMDRTEYELKNSLLRNKFSEEAISDAIEYVKSYGYVDDEKYVRQYIRCYSQQRSKKRIQFDLSMKKGVSKDIIYQAFEEMDPGGEKEVIRKLLKKKWNREDKPNEKELAKLFGYLSRQGFQINDIWCILHEENLT